MACRHWYKKVIPYTAGSILSEEGLRTYAKCSKLFFFSNDSMEKQDKLFLTQTAYERTIIDAIKRPDLNWKESVTKNLLWTSRRIPSAEYSLPGQIDDMIRSATHGLYECITLLDTKRYVPLTGPLPYKVMVSQTPVELRLSATFKDFRSKVLHAVVFTPYRSQHAILADPVNQLKVHTLDKLVKNDSSASKVKLHVFGLSETGKVSYFVFDKKTANPNALKSINSMVKCLEQEISFPLVPCPYACKFKDKCQ